MEENKKERNGKLSAIVEGILVIFAVILVVLLGYSLVLKRELTPIERKYNDNVYTISSTDSSITTVRYFKKGDLIAVETITHVKDGQAVEMIENQIFATIYDAKKYYEAVKDEYLPAVSIAENVVTLIFDSSLMNNDDYIGMSEEEKKHKENLRSFTKNEEYINYMIPRIEEEYNLNCKKIDIK